MKKIASVMILAAALYQDSAHADWVNISGNLPETDMRVVALHPKNPDILFAASERRIYVTHDQGKNWHQTLGVRKTADHINFISFDPVQPDTVYAGTAHALKRSLNGGKRWQDLFVPSGQEAEVWCVEAVAGRFDELWVGTAKGLYRLTVPDGQAHPAEGLPEAAVYSVWTGTEDPKTVIAATDRGIYRSQDGGLHWQCVYAQLSGKDGASEALSQFEIEELALTQPRFSEIVFSSVSRTFYTASSRGLLESAAQASDWKRSGDSASALRHVRALAAASRSIYAATDSSVYRWDRYSGRVEAITQGLSSGQARDLEYHPLADHLVAATKAGIYKYPYPEWRPSEIVLQPVVMPTPEEIFSRFSNEPTVRQVQEAAIRYAEVYPEKIAAWRSAASRKAILPTISLGADLGRDSNVDIDRGGTNDADTFIYGPDESSRDMSVRLSWDLGELVWNDDQTAIDTRSKLMTELRDDILNEVTHLYFERRRLQVQQAISPSSDPAVLIERCLRLDELTASIDALTGGAFSRALKPAVP